MVWSGLWEASRSSSAGRASGRVGSCRGDQGRNMDQAIMTLVHAFCELLWFLLHARQMTQFFTKPDTAVSPVCPVKIVNGEMLRSTVFPCRHSDAACQCPNQSSRPADDAPSLVPRPEELLIIITCYQPTINS
jgi:hypothetical protein